MEKNIKLIKINVTDVLPFGIVRLKEKGLRGHSNAEGIFIYIYNTVWNYFSYGAVAVAHLF
jgi:hypothetical protein